MRREHKGLPRRLWPSTMCFDNCRQPCSFRETRHKAPRRQSSCLINMPYHSVDPAWGFLPNLNGGKRGQLTTPAPPLAMENSSTWETETRSWWHDAVPPLKIPLLRHVASPGHPSKVRPNAVPGRYLHHGLPDPGLPRTASSLQIASRPCSLVSNSSCLPPSHGYELLEGRGPKVGSHYGAY